jgi:hypothetical protein
MPLTTPPEQSRHPHNSHLTRTNASARKDTRCLTNINGVANGDPPVGFGKKPGIAGSRAVKILT